MEKTKQELLKEWSELWIPKFNELSQKYNTPYYTQSPLNVIETDIELMVVGINTKGNGKCTSPHTVERYLEGNRMVEPAVRHGIERFPFSCQRTIVPWVWFQIPGQPD